MTDLSVTTYNVGSRNDDKLDADLDRLCAKPGVVALQECGDRQQMLARKGWWLLQGEEDGKAKVALLVHRDYPVIKSGYFKLSNRTFVGDWGAGPEVIATKWIAWAQFGVGERKVRVGCLHYVPSVQQESTNPGSDKRRDLYRKQVQRTVKWEKKGRVTHLFCGDFNATPDFFLLDPLKKAGLGHRSAPSHGKRDIDQHWFRRTDWLSVSNAHALDGYSSDHKPVRLLYVIT